MITRHFFQKRILTSILSPRLYRYVKHLKNNLDYIIGRDYDQINSFWNNYLASNAVIIDIGANTGQCMLRYSKKPERKIISIEPLSNAYKYLKRNKIYFKRKNVFLEKAAISGKSGHNNIYIPTLKNAEIDTQASLDNKRFIENDINFIKEEIRCITMDDLIKKYDLPRIDLIKIDAEGAEEVIISSALNAIKIHQPIISLETSHNESFLDDVFNLGYKPYYLINSNLIEAERFQSKVSKRGNLILIKNLKK